VSTTPPITKNLRQGLIAGVNDAGEQLIAGVNDTSDKTFICEYLHAFSGKFAKAQGNTLWHGGH
jgi:hypothetical protein